MAVEKILEKLQPEKVAPAPEKLEKSSSPEAKAERIVAHPDKSPEVVRVAEKKGESSASPAVSAQNFQAQRAAAIDSILSDGLNELFLQMKSEDQKKPSQK